MMKAGLNSSKEILDNFFSSLEKNESLDSKTVKCLVQLYNDGKLTAINIKNSLNQIRDSG